MKILKGFSLFLCIGLICTPICSLAKEGLSWEIVSEKDTADEDINDKDTEDDDTEDKKDSDEEDRENVSSDTNEDENNEEDEEEQDDDDEDESRVYPSGNIYSKEKTQEMISDQYAKLKEAYEIEDKFKRTKAIDRIDSFILNFIGDPLSDKKIAFLGDSITAGIGGTLTPDGSGMNYTDFIANYTSAEIINLGLGGTPIEGKDDNNAIVYRYKDIPKDTDIIVLFAGINDLFEGSDSFGSLENPERGTYCGDTLTTFQMIRKRHPNAKVYVVITYPNKMEDYKEYTGDSWQEYANIQIELAEKYDFNVIDLYKEGFLDSHDSRVRNAFFKDDIHPDDLGSEVLGRHILVHLLKEYVE